MRTYFAIASCSGIPALGIPSSSRLKSGTFSNAPIGVRSANSLADSDILRLLYGSVVASTLLSASKSSRTLPAPRATQVIGSSAT